MPGMLHDMIERYGGISIFTISLLKKSTDKEYMDMRQRCSVYRKYGNKHPVCPAPQFWFFLGLVTGICAAS